MEPVGVLMMTPSPEKAVMGTLSLRTSISTTRATAPLVMTASLRARSEKTVFPSRRISTVSIIRDSTVYFPTASLERRESSLCSTSAIKPTLPILTPRMGMPKALASLAAWRMVPSPPKQMRISASGSSFCMSQHSTCRGNLMSVPSVEKGRQIRVSTPALLRMRAADWAAFNPLSRNGLGLSTIFTAYAPPMSHEIRPPEPSDLRSSPRPRPPSDSPDIRCSPPVP